MKELRGLRATHSGPGARLALLPSVSVFETLAPIWVETRRGVDEVAGTAASAGLMALDTEADSLHSYFHKVCLVQVSVAGCHYLIDPLVLGGAGLAPLLEVVGDPGVITLMHGADYDVRMLDRDFGARIRGLHDTQIMAQLLGEPRTGLGSLLEGELGITLDKRFQRADWGRRPVPQPMMAYAAADTAFLEPLADRLRHRLEELGRWRWAAEDCARLEAVRFRAPSDADLGFERVKGGRNLKGEERDRLASLFAWREEQAQSLDRPPFRVLGNAQLVDLATSPPQTPAEMAERNGLGPRFVRRWGVQVLRVLATPDPAPRHRHAGRQTQLTSPQRKLAQRLAAERNDVAGRLGIEAGLLCPRAVLEALACCPAPTPSGADLERCGLIGWRQELLGERFTGCLKERDE